MKLYVKPDLFYENFELSQHIANCKYQFVNSVSDKDCYTESPNGLYAFTDKYVCDYNPNDNGEAYCYTNGSAAFVIFNS